MAKYGQTDSQLNDTRPVHAVAETDDSVAKPIAKQSRLGKFELFRSDNGEWRFNLKAGNGEVIAISEGYSSKDAALNGIESVKKNAQTKKVIEL